jgi:hypothetical protein
VCACVWVRVNVCVCVCARVYARVKSNCRGHDSELK